MGVILRKNNVIKTAMGTYHRALETPTHIYYVNYQEGDESACTKMYDRKMQLVSDNYFAHVGLTDDLINGTYNWLGKVLKENLEIHNQLIDNGTLTGDKYIIK